MSYKDEKNLKLKNKIMDMLGFMPEFMSRYIASIGTSTAFSTQKAYLDDLRLFLDALANDQGKPVEALCIDDMRTVDVDYINGYLYYLESYEGADAQIRSNKGVSLQRKYSSLRSLFKYLEDTDQIDKNPMHKIKMPKKEKKDIIRMDEKESIALLSSVNQASKGEAPTSTHQNAYLAKYGYRDYVMLALLLDTGMRVSEMVGLDVGSFNPDKHRLENVQRKGGKEQFIYLSDTMTELLQEYLEVCRNNVKVNSPALFLSAQQKRISVRAVEIIVKKYKDMNPKTSGLKLTPHKLRATFATLLYEKTSDLYLVSANLGHENVATSQVYAEMTNKKKEESRNQVEFGQ